MRIEKDSATVGECRVKTALMSRVAGAFLLLFLLTLRASAGDSGALVETLRKQGDQERAVGRSGSHVPLTTPSLVPDPDGYLECQVTASSTAPMGIVATIMNVDGTNVTEFGSGFRASPAATGNGLYYAEETAGSLDDGARYCKATVTGARGKDVHVSLTAFDANGTPGVTVEVP